jgi:hypothetical protein
MIVSRAKCPIIKAWDCRSSSSKKFYSNVCVSVDEEGVKEEDEPNLMIS